MRQLPPDSAFARRVAADAHQFQQRRQTKPKKQATVDEMKRFFGACG
jgi:hypothetical protein